MRRLEFSVSDIHNGALLKNFLRAKGISAHTLSLLKKQENGILLNGCRVTVRALLKSGDSIALNMPDDAKCASPEEDTVPVLFEDDDVIVLDKPPFMPTHPSKSLQSNTLAGSFAAHIAKRGINAAFRPVCRLDRGTSGLIVSAMHTHAASALAGRVNKVYLCIVTGELRGSGVIDAPIGLCDGSKIERCVRKDGDRAVTRYTSVCSSGGCSLLSVRIETGRTHQIRVHMRYIGHALLGDTLYGEPSGLLGRQALHCAQVSFVHPVTGELLHIKAPLPPDILNAADMLGMRPDDL